MKWSGGIFPSCRFYLTSVISATWVDSSTPLRCGRNDNGDTFLRIRLLFLRHFTLPRGPHQTRPLGRASFPQGKLLFRVGRHTASFLRRNNRDAPGTAHRPFPTVSLVGGTVQRHRLYSERGGRLIAAPTGVVPLIHTGYSCNAAGTAHRPFPTVSLMGVFFNQRIPKTGTSVTNNCQL